MAESEVARLMRQIDEAYQATQWALTGLASGVARHDFINAKEKRMAQCHQELTILVGRDEATALVAGVYFQNEQGDAVSFANGHVQEKGIMNSQPQGPIPRIPFDVSELQGIERLLWGYLHYLRRLPASPKNVKRRRSVEGIQQRLAAQLSSNPRKDIQLFLTSGDLEELLEAMREFATLVQQFFPKNEEREVVIETVSTWKRRLTRIISEFEA